MGKPEFSPQKIPVDAEGQKAFDLLLEVAGWHAKLNCVSMGNPHAVIFLEEDPKKTLLFQNTVPSLKIIRFFLKEQMWNLLL